MIVALVELTVGAATIGLLVPAEWGAVALTALFAGWTANALVRGRAGEPCACFAGLTDVGPLSLARSLALMAMALVAALARAHPTTLERVELVTGALAALCALLVWLSFALAQQVALLRGDLGRRGALEIPDEGPPLGQPSTLVEVFADNEPLLLAVFVSPGCRLCDELAPAIALLAAQAGIELAVLDEQRDALAWRAGAIPGSPYAVAMDPVGIALAKGTFNTAAQLESVAATALRRAGQHSRPRQVGARRA